jgi:hypothetical protein
LPSSAGTSPISHSPLDPFDGVRAGAPDRVLALAVVLGVTSGRRRAVADEGAPPRVGLLAAPQLQPELGARRFERVEVVDAQLHIGHV